MVRGLSRTNHTLVVSPLAEVTPDACDTSSALKKTKKTLQRDATEPSCKVKVEGEKTEKTAVQNMDMF
jgi:hypothetical protein